ncbi:TetR/AcrR family transcriptional regulator [Companilactobacillus kimchiensis]|uniref:TetR/AcrR family transcriptional regulator n=1 Tax=Companilactobacillus kimchiensis TaxID=993692 RepID=UPI0007107FF4|nr:TetR/AcrR family transcriptional regulator [Companilactobacillus kimchiensis]
MARKRSFDSNVVLDQIMIYFWRHGFQATGFRELTTETGIKAQSLYNAYGSKNALYYQALEHYVAVTSEVADGIVASDQTWDNKVAALLILDWGKLPYPDGCMVISSLSEFDEIDPKLNEVSNKLFEHLTACFIKVLQPVADELRADLEIGGIATQLLTIHNGIQVAVRDNQYPTDIRQIVATTIQALRTEKTV